MQWPAWFSWILFFSVVLTFIIVWRLAGNMAAVRNSLAEAGIGRAGKPARNRKELEERYVAGSISRDIYDRWKDRL